MIGHKFHAKSQELDGIKFASKKEARRYQELKRLTEIGEIVFFLRQVPFDLPGNTKYYCDFCIFFSDGSCRFEDVKGYKTTTYILKKKLVESLYPVEIIEI